MIGTSCLASMSSRRETGAVVAVGDSLTDANISTHDGHHSWPSQLARRLMARQSGRPMAVMNQGLGGNRILHDIRGDSGLRRFDRDVLAQPGVTHAVIMLGTNDLRNRNGKPEEEVTAPQMIGGLKHCRARPRAWNTSHRRHAHSVRERDVPSRRVEPEARSDSPGSQRVAAEDGRVRRDRRFRSGIARSGPTDPDAAQVRLRRSPSPERLGYRAMGDAIDLALFEEKP